MENLEADKVLENNTRDQIVLDENSDLPQLSENAIHEVSSAGGA